MDNIYVYNGTMYNHKTWTTSDSCLAQSKVINIAYPFGVIEGSMKERKEKKMGNASICDKCGETCKADCPKCASGFEEWLTGEETLV